jgi:hypothetical protein
MEPIARIFDRILSPYAIFALVGISLFLTILYFDTNKIVPSYVDQQIHFLAKTPVHFDEPINVGSGLLTYYTTKLLPLSSFAAFKTWQLVFFIGYLWALYAITSSMRLTLLGTTYPPLLIDSYQAYTSIGICLYALALLCILRKKITLGFLVAMPLMLISQESFVFFGGVLLYYFITEKSYLSFSSFLSFLNRYSLPIALLICAIAIYLSMQSFFYGSPIANFIYNQTNPLTFNFSPSVYVVRIAIFLIILATSIALFKFNKLLFTVNSLFFLTYLYFAIFGYDYLFIAIQRFYSGLLIYTIIALGYYAKIPMKLWA